MKKFAAKVEREEAELRLGEQGHLFGRDDELDQLNRLTTNCADTKRTC